MSIGLTCTRWIKRELYERYQSYDRVAQETGRSTFTVRKHILLLSLPEALQLRLGTEGGPAGIGALARLASTG
jgi:hypothetical protein